MDLLLVDAGKSSTSQRPGSGLVAIPELYSIALSAVVQLPSLLQSSFVIWLAAP